MVTLSDIVALAGSISKTNALKYGSIGIDFIEPNATGDGLIFYMANGMTMNIPLSLDFLFTKKYDPNHDGSVVKSDTIQYKDKDGNIKYVDGNFLVDRTNAIGQQLATTISINGTFTEFLKDFQGQNLADLCTYLDTHKQFINGILIGDTKEGSFKLINNNNKLELQRLENGSYNTVYVVGSNETDIINLNKGYSAINFRTSTSDMNLGRISTDNKSVQIGDVRFEKTYLSGQELDYFKLADDGESYNYVINNDTSITQNLTTFEVIINIPIRNKLNHCAIYGMEINNASTGYYNYNVIDVTTNNVVYTSGTDFELKQGLTQQLTTTGLHIEKPAKLIHLYCGRQYKIVFKAQSSISFKGGLINSVFTPYCILKYYLVESNKIISQKDVTDSVSSNNSTLVASAKSVYTLAQAVNSVSGGMSPIIPISPADFSALKKGTNGNHYVLTEDGSILGETVHKYDNIFIVNTFGEITATERDIIKTDYVLISANATPSGNIFITDIKALTVGKTVLPVMNDYPNQGSVKSAISDDNSYRVFIEWDRGSQEYCGQPNVNGKDVIGIEKLASSYTGYVDINSTDIVSNKIVATLGQTTYTIAFTIVTPPTINSITFGNIPVGQTELKQGDTINVTIVTDKPIDTVEFQDTGAFQYQLLSVENATSITVSGVIANRGTTLQNLKGSIKVRSTEGSWSSITESVDTLPLNNIKPSITINSISYPVGQGALKNTESATVNFTLYNTDINTPSVIGDDLSIGTQTSTSLVVTRLETGTTTYNDGSMNNLSFTLKRNANGTSVIYSLGIGIATIAPILMSKSLNTYNVVSGIGEVINNLTFSQKCKIKSISTLGANKGTLITGVTTTYNTTYDLGISAQDSDIHNSIPNNVNLVVTGLSGIDSSSISIPYYIRGFANKVLSFTYPFTSGSIGTKVVDVNKLNVNGYILTNPPFEICKVYDNNPSNINNDTADYYSISMDGLNLLLPEAVKQFGYSSSVGIQINISEIY